MMSLTFLLSATLCAWGLSLVAAGSPLASSVRVRTVPGTSERDVVRVLRRELGMGALMKRDQTNTVSVMLDTNWDRAVLLQLDLDQSLGPNNVSVTEGVEIVCTSCYIRGNATGEVSFGNSTNTTSWIDTAVSDIDGDIQNLTADAVNYFEDYMKEMAHDLGHHVDLGDFAFPTFNYSLEADIIPIPEVNLHFTFDGMEMYMLIDTTMSLGATYTLPLYQSKSELGIQITPDLFLGLTFTVDLILDADATVGISSGFHISLDDGLAIDIVLFGENASNITVNGGRFEFLPVQIESADAVFTAVLRVGVHAGFSLASPKLDGVTLFNETAPSLSGGIEVGVFADVAKFITNITDPPKYSDCEIGVVQSYELALGAAAGATVALDAHTWGPAPQTTIPIWYTQLDTICATKSTSTAVTPIATTTSRWVKRDDNLTTTTLTTTATYSGVSCLSVGMINCPASLQNTSRSTTTSTYVTTVSSGTDLQALVYPAAVQNSVSTTSDFGFDAKTLTTTTGSPVSYIPRATSSTSKNVTGTGAATAIATALHNALDDVEKVNNIIIGVSVGVGVPIVLVFIVAITIVHKKRQSYAAVPKGDAVVMTAEPYGHDVDTAYADREPHGHGIKAAYFDKPGKGSINVAETEL